MPTVIEDWPDGPAVVKRAGTSAAVNTCGEAAGLRWLADAEAAGGARIPRVYAVDERRLVIERIATGTPTRDSARRFGAALARTHAAGAEWFGAPPPGWSGPLVVGRSRTPLVARNEAPARWGEFFARYRLRSYLRVLVDRGDFTRTEAAVLERVAHGGHAETDLALLALFGLPHLDDVLAGYNAASPLADGWRQRVGLHQLTPLLLHCVLFGGGYLGETLTMARTYA
ncbi:fructosamine kinase family protein [Raineyella sp. W15-4]|uniref:fructosamine kinase family protein n=1 Tax=Raineyella sp. W15-4 TaxID=3081651 RepID=UPI0029531101|nr:fructosamine kinase family protein [Raineyella sp. W15-4]WOQ15785.1 fructosamine kinase family protein [Raineyella sp. W15-4]